MGLSTTRLSAAIVTLAITFTCHSANAQQPTSSNSGTLGQSPVGRMVSGLNPMNWKMPNFKSMLPTQDEKTRIKKQKTGLMTEVKQTASRSWTKTKQVLNPKRLVPTNMFGMGGTPQRANQNESPGFFGSLFQPQPEVRQVSSVNEFLSQDRPAN